MKKHKMPEKLVSFENIEKAEELFNEKPLQADFCHDNCVKIKQGGYILLDFGCELRGGIAICTQLTSNAPFCATVRVVFGESISEAMSKIGEKQAGNYHAARDMTVEIPSMSTTRVGSTGFRFVKIEAIKEDINIKTVQAETEIKELEYKGSFECNDELLNRIWKTGAYTVQLNMGEYVWDGVKRDRLVWIGDMHPETSTITSVFGYDDSVPKSLDLIKRITPQDKWMNGIATYSMWWIINHYDWYMQQGDKEYLKEQVAYISNMIDHAAEWVDGGYTVHEDMENFVDWSSKGTESEIEGLKSVVCLGFSAAEKIFDIFGMSDRAAFAKRYVDMLKNDISDIRVNKRVAGLNILADRNIDISREVLSGNSAEEMSCFMGYYVLLAKAKLNDTQAAMDIIRKYWGGMLKMGATTFWEDFDIAWMENSYRIDELPKEEMRDIHGDFGKFCYTQFRHSLCHGWASGPTAFMSKHILGVEIMEAGCKKIRIVPDLGDLQWVRGSYPTPFGTIFIEHKRENGKIVTSYKAPKEIEVVIEQH